MALFHYRVWGGGGGGGGGGEHFPVGRAVAIGKCGRSAPPGDRGKKGGPTVHQYHPGARRDVLV